MSTRSTDKQKNMELLSAARKGHTALVVSLRDGGADVNTKNKDGESPAHTAAFNGHTDTVRCLHDSGADINAADNEGRTPLHKAAYNGHAHTVELLRDRGAQIDAKDSEGRAPIHKAAYNGHAAATALLCESGADVDAKDNGGQTAAHKAAFNGHSDVVGCLHDRGADINAKDHEGRSPAHSAAYKGHAHTVALLIDRGADLNATDNEGRTCTRKAVYNGHAATVRFLKCVGANMTANNKKKSLLDVAKDRGHVDVVRVLETDRAELLLEDWTATNRELQAKNNAISATSEAALVAVFADVSAAMDGPDGWAAQKQEVDGVAAAVRGIEEFNACRDNLSIMLAAQGHTQSNASCKPSARRQDHRSFSPAEIAHCRSDCCAAAEVLLNLLPPMAAASSATSKPACERGIGPGRPHLPPEFVHELTVAVAAAKQAHENGTRAVAQVGSGERCPLAAVIQAALHANAECGAHAQVLRTKLREARAMMAGPAACLTAEECGRYRAAANAVLAAEGPWAGTAGLERRGAALARVAEAVAAQKSAQRTVKRAERALARAELDAHSSDDEVAGEGAEAQLRKARAEYDAALPALLSATAAVQEWATSGEGALTLRAFPCDAGLAAVRADLFPAGFTAETELPQTPGVEIAKEYIGGLTKTPAPGVFFAQRRAGNVPTGAPVVLRRLRLDSASLVEEARRQLTDAGKIAVGLQACPDAATGCPSIVKATRWFVAEGPEGGAPDAWLEFPQAQFGSLAQALERGVRLSAVASRDLCQRLARAVAQLHAAGIRHGDLNPSNVVLWDDPASDLVRPGIIDLLDTAVVGATRTLRGATLEWLPPEATKAVAKGAKAYATRQLDCWQLGRICLSVLDASVSVSSDAVGGVRAVAARLCVTDPAARLSAAAALHEMERAAAGATAAAAAASERVEWALPPELWQCQRGAARGVDFVELDPSTDTAASALTACATAVGRTVRAVYRLENVQLWRVYAAELARVAEQAQGAPWPPRLITESQRTFAPLGAKALSQETPGGPGTGEALLLHGAATSHRLIAEGGFDPSYSGDNVGALFGAATCLTPSWAKAANQYARGAGAGVFVTRAAVGHVADCLKTPRRETSQYRRPPDGHHSVLGDNGGAGAVVAVYRPSQMYPEYLVVFDN